MPPQPDATAFSFQRPAGGFSRWFVQAVLLAALVTFTLWWHHGGVEPRIKGALIPTLAVLIAAFPLALRFAAPFAARAALARAAKEDIRLHGVTALEAFGRADTLIIDKTGTLTEGQPAVTSIIADAGLNEDDVLRIAASLERDSAHPLAAAILYAARQKKIEPVEVASLTVIPGKGVIGKIEGRRVTFGNLVLLKELSIAADSLREKADALRQKGQTVMFLGIDDTAAGLVAVTDTLKPGAAAAIKTLRDSGLRVIMLTGDNQTTAEAVARKAGITEVEAGVVPERKSATVLELRSRGRKVAIAGHGIDSALAAADVGIAMGDSPFKNMGDSPSKKTGGSPLIKISDGAYIALDKGDLTGLVRAHGLSRALCRNIRQNVIFSFACNAIGLPLAATGLIGPLGALGVLTLNFAGIAANALRLRVVKLG